jgi:tetratricopeptide (TPR) repeat protein
MVNYYRAYCEKQLGNCGCEYVKTANACKTGYCFPSRLEDILVLKNAISTDSSGANAYYYLGCLCYDKFRYTDAAKAWENCVANDSSHGKAWRNLSLYYFDKANDAVRARICLEKALEFKDDDPRLLLEYEQLLKNTNCSIDERLAVYEKYPELLKERDDCYLDKLTLICQKGDFKTAISMAAAKRFHIYEGGEGKLTKQHAWMHTLYGNELTMAGKYEEAEQIYMNGVNMPKSYGEAKTFFNQEAHIFYYLAKLYAKMGKVEQEKQAYEQAAIYKAAVSELSLFRALALKELGQHDMANTVIDEMIKVADNLIGNKDLRTYYGVGSPSPMPFEYDIEKNNLRDGSILKAFALLGYGKTAEAEVCMETARELDPNDFRIFAFDKIK